MRTAGIIQSNYIPWRGYFDFIASVDVFVLHDDLQYTKGDWRNRNRFRLDAGSARWVTVPVTHLNSHQLIQDTRIATGRSWARQHLACFDEAYAKAPFFRETRDLYAATLLAREWQYLSELNAALIRSICNTLNIRTEILMSADLACTGSKTCKLLALIERLGADQYLSGPAARSYLDVDLLKAHGISTRWKHYDYPDYPQGHPGFLPGLSMLDTLAWVGPGASAMWHCLGPGSSPA